MASQLGSTDMVIDSTLVGGEVSIYGESSSDGSVGHNFSLDLSYVVSNGV